MTSSPSALPTPEEARVIGATLRPVSDELLRQRPGQRSRWWVSDARYIEVSVFDDDGGEGPLLVEVGIRGRLARFRRGTGISTSVTEELNQNTALPTSRLESQDTRRQDDVVSLASIMLAAAPDPTLRAISSLFAAPT